MRTALFFRDFGWFTGGHLKVWHYFEHVRAADGWDARIVFTPGSVWDATNPWNAARDAVVATRAGVRPDLVFLEGNDWLQIPEEERERPPVPVVNLIGGVRHAKDGDSRRPFLRYPATRICCSRPVAEAIAATGDVNGPVVVIPNGLDLDALPPPRAAGDRRTDLLVVGVKRPRLAKRLAKRLRKWGRTIDLLDERVPRGEFLDRLGRARVALFLPLSEEGFYLPALEGMALGTLVVCPDCIGNRDFCLDGTNCLRPADDEEAVAAAADRALTTDAAAASALVAKGRETALAHGLDAERRAFHALLARTIHEGTRPIRGRS